VGWGLNLVDLSMAKTKEPSPRDELSAELDINSSEDQQINLDDLLDREPNMDTIGIPSELADQLAQIDIVDLMPKLPVLSMPTTSSVRAAQASLAELFSSQALLDEALHSGAARELYALNAFLLLNKTGAVRIIVYDSLSIGDIPLPLGDSHRVQNVRHTSHPLGHCHVLLSEYNIGSNQYQTALLPISFRFLKSAGKNIHFIDFKTAQLALLFQYVGESILAIEHHWKHAQDLPSRFQRNIKETLQGKEEPNLAQSLYQLAATGFCTEIVKEWLTDELAQRVC
jgi:anaphase-promoting complex subunit 4